MDTFHGFQLVREQAVAELNTKARLFRHVKTGAELLSLENDDTNKVFGITFRTPPPDSTGLPHILEHSVLSGSRKYPVKEPFVELVKGSLKTFVNAMTYPDKTCYPVASQNLQDFYNLVDVYLDAVLYPLIPPHVLEQEGWHYELESLDGEMNFKGVVFNEMKGAYSSPDNVLYKQSQESLYPDTAYGLDSGGDPTAIPDLTYTQFKSYHQTLYHPSNALIFFYGDDDPQERLCLLDDYLKDFDRLQVEAVVALQPQFDRPRRLVLPYDTGADQDGHKALLTVNWLLPETGDTELVLGLNVLEHILIATPASPLRKALIDSGLGEDLAGAGFETALRQMNFSTGMKGVARADTDQVEALILTTLESLCKDGFDADTIAASLNTIEFGLRENNTGSYPRGLLLMLRALATWLYCGDPLAPLAFEAPLAAVKRRVEQGERYFENLLQNYFITNPHRTTVILEPDSDLAVRRAAAERARLDKARTGMSATELQAVVENTLALKRRQETPDSPEALATIPSLMLTDLDREVKKVPSETISAGLAQILYHDLFTNGILYLDLGFDLHSLPQEYLPYVPLFGQALLEMGTQSEDFVRLTQRIGRSTGGISPSWFVSARQHSEEEAAWFILRAKATVAHTDELLAIMQDVLLTAQLDNRERFKQIVLEAKAGQETQLVPSGHRMVNRRLRAHFTSADWAIEQMDGISTVFFLRQLAEQIDQDWPAVLEILEDIRRRLLDRDNLLLNATVDAENWRQVQPRLSAFSAALPARGTARNKWQPAPFAKYEGLTIPAQVNYVGKGANLYDLGFQYSGAVDVVTAYLRITWLWERVRVQGGAYGAYCLFDRQSGVLTFLSYRDPNLLGTLDVYDQSADFLRQLELSPAEQTKSIIGVIGDMDAYQLPDAKGYSAMIRNLLGISDEERQRIRDQVLATTQSDFQAFADVLAQVQAVGQVAVLGSPEALTAANAGREGWLEIIKVL